MNGPREESELCKALEARDDVNDFDSGHSLISVHPESPVFKEG